MKWTYFPKNQRLPKGLDDVIDVFCEYDSMITSSNKDLKSDEVLSTISPGLEGIGYIVEKSKKDTEKIKIPVMYGENGATALSFDVDAFHSQHKVVIEVEAGRAVTNYQFLKDFYEACCMEDIDYLVIAVREVYGKARNKDYRKICSFFDTMYLSNRFTIPLKGILIIGY